MQLGADEQVQQCFCAKAPGLSVEAGRVRTSTVPCMLNNKRWSDCGQFAGRGMLLTGFMLLHPEKARKLCRRRNVLPCPSKDSTYCMPELDECMVVMIHSCKDAPASLGRVACLHPSVHSSTAASSRHRAASSLEATQTVQAPQSLTCSTGWRA